MEMNNDKYQNRYRIPSTRLQNWNYGWNAIYFVTICTKNRRHFFGEITNGKMHLSPVGAIADVLWHELTNHFDGIELDAFVVMPNHIHGIVVINDGDNGTTNGNNTIKVESDYDYIYIYSLRAADSRYSEIWNGEGYVGNSCAGLPC